MVWNKQTNKDNQFSDNGINLSDKEEWLGVGESIWMGMNLFPSAISTWMNL